MILSGAMRLPVRFCCLWLALSCFVFMWLWGVDMPTISVSTYVDVEFDLDDASAKDLAKALVEKDNWQQALDAALNKTTTIFAEPTEHSYLREIIDAHRLGKDLTPFLSSAAFNQFGLVI